MAGLKVSHRKVAGSKRKAAEMAEETTGPSPEASESEASESEDTPFTIVCPALPLDKRAEDENPFQEVDDPADLRLKVRYTITPGQLWSRMRPYQKMRCMFLRSRSTSTAHGFRS